MEGIVNSQVRKNHVNGTFGWGNYKSLVTDPSKKKGPDGKPIDMLVELRKFFDSYYKTNRMSVCVV